MNNAGEVLNIAEREQHMTMIYGRGNVVVGEILEFEHFENEALVELEVGEDLLVVGHFSHSAVYMRRRRRRRRRRQ